MNKQLNDFFQNATKWGEEMSILRSIVLDCLLKEEVKWGVACYTFNNKNILLIHDFKEYCGLLFMKGALLQDTEKFLCTQTKNVQSGRQIRFTSAQEILGKEAILKAYIFEAIEIEKAGLKIEYKKADEFTVPEELTDKFELDPSFKAAFESLTPGRQKGYLLHFSEAKQAKTREARIEKYTPKILDGKGMTDCTCGLSKRMPNCDGSHKQLS